MEAYLGMICLFPQNYIGRIPEEWEKCDGRELQVRDYQALYAVLGNEFGGVPSSTFALPKLSPLKPANGGDVDYYICVRGLFPCR